MKKYFLTTYNAPPFRLFSISHITALGIIVFVASVLILTGKSSGKKSKDLVIRYSLSAVLILQEISLSAWRLYNDTWQAGTSLPLHLCGAAIVLSAIMLINKNYSLYEVCYFWGLGGAIQALLTPDIGPYSFPHYRFFQFFVSHGSIVAAVLYMTFVHKLRPRFSSVFRVFLITNIYMLFIAGFNLLTNGNYLFICRKPDTASLMDYMGPWPWYILTLEITAIASFLLYYSPFALSDMIKQRKTSMNSKTELRQL